MAVIRMNSETQRILVAANYPHLGSQHFLTGYLSLSLYQQKKMKGPKQNRKKLILKCELLTRAEASLYLHTRFFYNLEGRGRGRNLNRGCNSPLSMLSWLLFILLEKQDGFVPTWRVLCTDGWTIQAPFKTSCQKGKTAPWWEGIFRKSFWSGDG